MICRPRELSTTRTACDLAGELIDRSLRAEKEFLSAAMIAPAAALQAAIDVDLTGADWVADHHSAIFWWLCVQCAERGHRWNAAAFVQAARAAGIDVDAEDVDTIEFGHDAFPKMLPMHSATVKDYSDQRRQARFHFSALDNLGARLADRDLIDVTAPKPKPFAPPRLRRKAGRPYAA